MFGSQLPEGYRPVGNTEDIEITSHPSSPETKRQSRTQSSLVLAVVSLLTLVVGFYAGRTIGPNTDSLCIAHTSNYGPILEDTKIRYTSVQFDGRFNHENIYRQDGSPTVDAAWEALGISYRPVVIPDELAAKSGLTPNHGRRAEKYGGGYLGNLEGLHHLHCLNLVRKSIFYNYDYYQTLGEHEFSNDGDVLRWHISHCLDVIRQQLMCTVDIGALGSVWINSTDGPYPFPDFRTNHICRNYEEIRAWAEMSQIPPDEELPEDFMEVPGPGVEILHGIP
ncbi:hypothetical protein QBC46DRAFT_420336 [Diplogelasinospora grovesii]|uniref:Tat pathway signal sequence n=1 Tax=Diplogelasinospora grovesii TaxID=303347 RepID=A0AAN6MZQ5_9PEZI|nr:hypothetical protein QBC46DRAFT_420336 [Diplogelasinospora grovesii]